MNGKVGVLKMAEKTTSKYTEDWLPITAITNGMIVNKNDEKITGIKIMPKNIFILDQYAQDNTIIALKNFYNTIDYEFWIICADRPVDISLYLSQLQLLYNSTQSPVVRKLAMEDLNKANNFMGNNVVDTEFFLLFKERDMELISKRIRMLISNMAACGLNASQTTNDDLRTIIENFINGGMRTEFGTVVF